MEETIDYEQTLSFVAEIKICNHPNRPDHFFLREDDHVQIDQAGAAFWQHESSVHLAELLMPLSLPFDRTLLYALPLPALEQ
jgi:hypothetical protein